MARDVITLRPVPAAESGAHAGDSAYADIAFLQCRRYIALLRLALGPEPEGARLRVRRSDSDCDPYIDVVVEFDDQNPAASDYARRCERDAPTRWRDAEEPATESAQTSAAPIRGRGAERDPVHSMEGNGHGRGADNDAMGVVRRGGNRAKEDES